MTKEDIERFIDAIEGVALALKSLGTAEASTHLGAIESLALEVQEGSTRIAEGLNAIASAIENRET